MSLQMIACAADLAAIQVTAIGVMVAFWLVVRTASLVSLARPATAKFPLTGSVRVLTGSQFRNAREPRSNSR
jgi:hypothetical protein